LHLIVVGLNHRTAPIELREKLAFTEARLTSALEGLVASSDLREAVILSTCNRTEVYVRAAGHEEAQESVIRYLTSYHAVRREEFAPHLYVYRDEEAVRHLFRVACGLDSLVLGEPQILHQVREAFSQASEVRTAGAFLNGLFRSAIFTGRRARAETNVGAGGFSIGHAAVDLSRSIFGDLRGASVLVLGAGKMSELTAKHLIANGVKVVFVANRTHERAQQLASRLGGTAIRYDQFPDTLAVSDIVISSTASPTPVLKRETVLPLLRKRRGRPLFLIDIAVPRDIEHSIADLDNVFLYDIDDLQNVVADMARERSSEVVQVESIIGQEVTAFETWWRSLTVAPVVTQIKRKHEAIRQEELARLRNQLPDLPESAWRNIEAALKSYMNKAHRDAVHKIKQVATSGPNGARFDLVEAARELFGLPDEDMAPTAPWQDDLDPACTAHHPDSTGDDGESPSLGSDQEECRR
jgi:glutamyl-tRNA reductase